MLKWQTRRLEYLININVAQITKEQIELACAASITMGDAALKCSNVNYKTFRKYAKLWGFWRPNPSGKGKKKTKNNPGKDKFLTEDILSGKHPGYSSHKLRVRLI